MYDEFRSATEALWTWLGLGKPTYRDAGSLLFQVDGLDLEMTESRDGSHLVISASAGRLAADPAVQRDQVEAMLKANLGLLLSNGGGVSLCDTQERTPAVRVQAVYAYKQKSPAMLASVVEDVLFLADFHADLLRAAIGFSDPWSSSAIAAQAMIVRP